MYKKMFSLKEKDIKYLYFFSLETVPYLDICCCIKLDIQ